MRTPTREEMEAKLLANRSIEDRGYKTRCWIWTGGCISAGYGSAWFGSGVRGGLRVHRLAAVVWMGFDLDSPLHVLHHCDNPPCFNPRHLFIGTALDNMRDMMDKGRHRFIVFQGEAQTNAKLTEDAVRVIRATVAEHGEGYGVKMRLARRFGVTSTAIYYVVRGITWKHVE